MTFLQQLTGIASLREKTRKTYRRTDVKTAFIEHAKQQIQAINTEGRAKGHWFRREADGTYVVQLKNGATSLKLDGKCSEVHCADASGAVAVLNLAIIAAQAGELDALLETTKRAPRKTKKDGDVSARGDSLRSHSKLHFGVITPQVDGGQDQ